MALSNCVIYFLIINCCCAGQNSCSLLTFNQIAVVLLSVKLSIKVSLFPLHPSPHPSPVFKHLYISSKKTSIEPGCQFLPKMLKVFADNQHAHITEAGFFHTRCRRNSCYQITLVDPCHIWSTQESRDQTQPHPAVLLEVLHDKCSSLGELSPVLPFPQASYHFYLSTMVWLTD